MQRDQVEIFSMSSPWPLPTFSERIYLGRVRGFWLKCQNMCKGPWNFKTTSKYICMLYKILKRSILLKELPSLNLTQLGNKGSVCAAENSTITFSMVLQCCWLNAQEQDQEFKLQGFVTPTKNKQKLFNHLFCYIKSLGEIFICIVWSNGQIEMHSVPLYATPFGNSITKHKDL